MSSPYYVSKQHFIPAPAEQIFDLLAHAEMHAVIDGSNTVRTPSSETTERLSLGASFGMCMNMIVGYKVLNVVCEFEEGRRIAWQNPGKAIWRYILAPASGGTLVTEEWDARKSPRRLFMRLMRFPTRNTIGFERTLANLEAHFTATA